MKNFLINAEISEKLRGLVTQKFESRGRFKELETLSGISASKWKNFLYKKQEATQELIQFWVNTYHDHEFAVSENANFAGYLGDKEVSARLREFISLRFQARGRFTKLESLSGIKDSKWKSFYYGKQGVSQDLLIFWCSQFPDTQNWILTGNHAMIEGSYPSDSPTPDLRKLTIADRLIWVINKSVSCDGQQLFDYLAKKSSGKISAEEWEKAIQKTDKPTLEMLSVACDLSPYYIEWIISGRTSKLPQTNPFDPDASKKLSLLNLLTKT
jgi:hypothetical protein